VLSVGSLFSGIGGFDLGLERAGMRVAWQCEADEFCRRVLTRHWPDVPCYPDVRELRADDVGRVDVLCGGFPCQDISSAGLRAGITGARSGLWGEYARLVGELRPRYVIVENVADLLARGMGTVLADLAALGYDAEWDCIPASAVGAPHQRDRVWIVAYPNSKGQHGLAVDAQVASPPQLLVDTDRAGWENAQGRPGSSEPDGRPVPGPDALGRWAHVWATEPDVGRVVDGVSVGLDSGRRIRSLGNALVPQIAEWLGRRILEWEGSVTA
jgi:DNA (cytosine-5)-methyltransferase 1